MTYTVHSAAGEAIAGDTELDDVLRAAALIAGGYVTDDSTGERAYESPAYLEQQVRLADEERARREAEEAVATATEQARIEREKLAALEAEVAAQAEADEE